jgi:hypothetical protein
MNAISRPSSLKRVALPPARERFWYSRRTADLALLHWLQEQPDPRDIAEEIDASISVLRQLGRLARAGCRL